MLIFGISSLSCVGFWHRELLACPVSPFPDAFCIRDDAERLQEEVQNRDLTEMRKRCGKSAGKMQERPPTSTLRRGKVPKGRPARAPTSTAERGTKKNECTKGVGAEGAPLCAGGDGRPSFFFAPRSAVEVGALAGRPLGTLPRRSVEVGSLSCTFPHFLHNFSASLTIPGFALLPR